MKRNIDHIAHRVMIELQGCLEDNDNGSSLIDMDDYEATVKDFLYAHLLATGVLIEKLTGNGGDNIDTISLLTRLAFEYSNQETKP